MSLTPWWRDSHTELSGKPGAIHPGCIGFVIATALAVLARYGGINSVEWGVYIWPFALMLGGISGHATFATVVMTIAVSAFLNAILYGIFGWTLYRIYLFVRR
jgi:hypothetical protein